MKPTQRIAPGIAVLPVLTLLVLSTLRDTAPALTTPPQLGLDRNQNGLSDVWETMYPLATNPAGDNDGDGRNNQAEAAAGTNPHSAANGFVVASVTYNNGQVTVTWPSVTGKLYQLQESVLRSGGWSNLGAPLTGSGGSLSRTIPVAGLGSMLRVQVSDADTDADGVTDWEEIQAGTDRYLYDTDGDSRPDANYVASLLNKRSVVNVYPETTWIHEGPGYTARFRVTRHGSFLPLAVGFLVGGSAVRNVDYTLSATGLSSTYLHPGWKESFVTITVITDAVMEDAETITLSLSPLSTYDLGPDTSATITIVGQGLNGQYFNTSSGTYSDPLNFAPETATGLPALSRTDAAVNFDWSKPAGTPPGTGTGTPGPQITDDDVWTARWTGFIYPKTSELYQIHAYADRGVVVWVSPTPITAGPGTASGARLNLWSTGGPAVKNSANLLANSASTVAGQPLYLRVDYRDSTTFTNNANIQLRWSAPGVPEEVIPANAFSREGFPGGPPALTSPLSLAAIAGAPFSFQLTASGAPAAFRVSGLPAGLTADAAGLINGVINAAQGYYPLSVTALNAAGSDSETVVLYVTTTGGSATREIWQGVAGNGLSAIPLHIPPSETGTVATLSSPADAGDNYGERLRGYITAPTSGLYTFFVTSDENAEIWVSSSEEPARRLKRAWVSRSRWPVGDGVWDAQPGQRSVPMRLRAGNRYYFEVIRRESTGGDHLAIAWLKPGLTDPAQRETIPGWALSPWSPPPSPVTDGTLYAATLTPQPGAATLGSGSALLLVNAARTSAKLSYTFSNLTGPVNSGAHIHDARTIIGQAGRILYDIDDFDADVFGNYPWVFAAGSTHTVADLLAAIEGGHAYLNLHTAAYPDGEVRGTFYPVSGSQFFVPPAPPPAAELTLPADPAAAKREAVRFLQQATFGARHDTDGVAPWDADSIEAVQALGYTGWVDAQLAMPAGANPETLRAVTMPPAQVFLTPTDTRPAPNAMSTLYYGSGPFSAWIADYYLRYPRTALDDSSTQSSEELWRSWWALSVKGQDQLRQRMAFALSQILVVSEEGGLDEDARAVAHYYDLLYYHGLGNFRTLLERITLNPAMGVYLDMLGNRKPDPASGRIPNENYAREILQLFSVGLMRLHPDGSAVLSLEGLPVATYEQDNVVGYAHTFTGWTYPGTSSDKITAMTPRPADHYTGDKLLLEEAVIPAASPATVDTCNAALAAALDIIFHHPNTGPFICRQLIQRMITANPSTGYVHRVSSVFNDDGTGVRGNLSAVARAILLDPEARNAAPRMQTGYGHLKEPVLRATQMLRAFKGFSYGERTYPAPDLGVAIVGAINAGVHPYLPIPTTSITINGVSTPYTVFDGVALAPGNTVLLRANSNAALNGLFVFQGNGLPMVRAANADTPAELDGAWVKVIAGQGAGKIYRQTATITNVDTDPQVWTEQTAANPRRRLWGMGSTNSSLSQTPLRSPTVFNFFEPSYVYLGHTGQNGLYAPEFQITTETSVISAGSWFYDLTRYNTTNATTQAEPFTAGRGADHGDPVRRDIKLDLTAERALADDSAAVLDRIGDLLMPGMMDPRYKTLLANYLETLPEGTDANRMRRLSEALYIISLTPEFTWQR